MGLDQREAIDVESRIVDDAGAQPGAAEPQQQVDAEVTPAPTPVLVVQTAIARLDPIQKVLNDLRKEIATTTFDINTTAGEETARKLRQKCVKVRTSAEATYKELNAPLLEVQRNWREKVKAITTAVEPLEAPLDQAISAKEEAREKERQRKIAEEQARVAALRTKISAIGALPAAAVSMDAAGIDAKLLELQDQPITEETFGEFVDEAIVLRTDVIAQLKTMAEAKRADEKLQADLTAEATRLREQKERETLERALRTKIDAVKNRAFEVMGKTAVQIEALRQEVVTTEPAALEFGELHGEAMVAWNNTVAMIDNALAFQTSVERVQAEAAERQRNLDEQEREAAQQRQADEANLAKQRADLAEQQRKLDEASKPQPQIAAIVGGTSVAEAVIAATADAERGTYIGLRQDEAPAPSMSMFSSQADYQAALTTETLTPAETAAEIVGVLQMADYPLATSSELDVIELLLNPLVQEALAARRIELQAAGVQREEIPA